MNQTNTRRTFFRSLRKPALALVSTLLAFLLGEVVVRFSGRTPEVKSLELDSGDCVYKRSPNALLGFELKTNYRNDAPDLIQSYERTNAHGQRDKERTVEKPAGVQRVLLLGDSVVEGYRVAEEETISRQLENLLADDSTEVLNFGVSAYCTRAEVELLEVKGIKFAPDVVVLLFVENDFDNFNREAFSLEGTIERPKVVETLFLRSHLFRLTSVQLNLFQFGAEADPVGWNKDASGDNNVVDGLKRFRELADQHHFRPLVVVWPRFFDDRIEDVHFIPDFDELVVEKLAADDGIPCVRLSDYFRRAFKLETPGENPRLLYTTGDKLHPSEKGCQVAANAIKTILSDLDAGRLSLPKNTSGADATELARKLGQELPTYSRVFERTGRELLKAGKTELSVVQFVKALKEDPNNGIAHYNLGVAYNRLGRSESRHHFFEAVRVKPGFAPAHFMVANIMLKAGDAGALEQLQLTVKADPSNTEAHNLLAVEFSKQGRLDQAMAHLQQVVQLQPLDAIAHNNLGALCTQRGDFQQAAFHFAAAVKADPAHPEAASNLKKIEAMLRHRGN